MSLAAACSHTRTHKQAHTQMCACSVLQIGVQPVSSSIDSAYIGFSYCALLSNALFSDPRKLTQWTWPCIIKGTYWKSKDICMLFCFSFSSFPCECFLFEHYWTLWINKVKYIIPFYMVISINISVLFLTKVFQFLFSFLFKVFAPYGCQKYQSIDTFTIPHA